VTPPDALLLAVIQADAAAVAAHLPQLADRGERQALRKLLAAAWALQSAGLKASLPDEALVHNAVAVLEQLAAARRRLEPGWRAVALRWLHSTGRRRRWGQRLQAGRSARHADQLASRVAQHTQLRFGLSAARLQWWEARWAGLSPPPVASVRAAPAELSRLELPLLHKRGSGDVGRG